MNESVPMLARELGIGDHTLLEQDIRLHELLWHFTQESDIKGDLLFKGGTCLIKCHLDYPRFSVDLDFTWRDQAPWAGASTATVRDLTRSARDAWRTALTDAAEVYGYGFDADAITWGSSSRMGTAQFGFTNVHGEPGLVKIQVNFAEPLCFAPVTRPAKSLITGRSPKAIRLLDDPVLERYQEEFMVACYDAREIAAEKCRAILTRRAPKGRDVLDLFLLERDRGIRVEDLQSEAQMKLDFALGLGEKYNLNLDEAPERLQALAEQDMRPLLLKDIDLEAFGRYRDKLLAYLRGFLSA